MVDWALAAAIGFVSGVLSGAFGIGGGIVTTPATRLLLGVPALMAVGTPLPVIVPSAITGALSYHRKGHLDLFAGVVLAASGSLTAIAGAWLTKLAGGTVVLVGTAVLILVAATDMLAQVLRPPTASSSESGRAMDRSTDDSNRVPTTVSPPRPRLVPLVAIGALTGAYSGFFGLGGGFVLVPLLTRWLHFPLKRAIGTSLVAVAMLAIPGTITHALLGHVDWLIAFALAIGVVPGALLGARLTLGAHERQVRVAFAVMLLMVAGVLATTELGWLRR